MISLRGAARRAFFSTLGASMVSGAAMLFAACSSNVESAGVITDVEAGTSDAPDGAGPDASAAGPLCEGACKVTSIEAALGGKKVPLDRAQFGTQQGEAGLELHLEAHFGGRPECPVQTSPSPDRTMIVTAVPIGKGASLSTSDGVLGSFLDFKGDLGLPPATKALTLTITGFIADTATPPAWVAFDVSATYAEGTAKGHVYAAHCTTMDAP